MTRWSWLAKFSDLISLLFIAFGIGLWFGLWIGSNTAAKVATSSSSRCYWIDHRFLYGPNILFLISTDDHTIGPFDTPDAALDFARKAQLEICR